MTEASPLPISPYYRPEWAADEVRAGRHREAIGGLWDEMGALQRDFLLARGLQPHHNLLDIGCGSLRLAAKLLPDLEAGRYWGTDMNAAFIEAGYAREIVPAGLAARLPRAQLVEDAEFAFPGIPAGIDYAIAQSVFTHLPLNHLRLCLARLAKHVTGHGTGPCRFYFTIFTPDPARPDSEPCPQGDGVVSYPHRDPYHYTFDDLRHAARGLPWRLTLLGDWNHPRNQKMVEAVLDHRAAKGQSPSLLRRLARGLRPAQGGVPQAAPETAPEARPAATPALPKIIWMLWHQGWDKAPAVAQAARRNWARQNPGWEVRALDQKSLAAFLPAATLDFIYGKPKELESMSNLVRMELLWRHGGVWADATTLCARPLDDWLVPAMPQGFFAFERPGEDRMIATWFLAALPQNPLVGTWRNTMMAYWQGRDARHIYFWTHGLFGQCYENDPVFRAIWDGTVRLPARHRFIFGPDSPVLLAPPREDLAAALANPPGPVFKLTHKFTTPPQAESLFHRLCDLAGGA